jgi:hypothetical protein
MSYTVKMSHAAVNAANHCMTNTEAKGSRSDLRNHSRVVRAMQRDCFDKRREIVNGEAVETVRTKESVLHLDEARFDYFREAIDAIVKKSVPGVLTIGYDDLLEAMDAAEKEGDNGEAEPAKLEDKVVPIAPTAGKKLANEA